MNRRRYLRDASVALTSGLAGCAGVLGATGNPNTHLPKPSDQKAKSRDLVYPAWGQRFPKSTLPAVFHGGSITLPDSFSGKNFFATFFYSHCPTVCPVQISDMRAVQTKALKAGYDTAFAAATFDPRQDTNSRLQTFAKDKYVNLDAGDWYFLRPPDPQTARKVVQGTYGIKFGKSFSKNGTTYYNHMSLIFLVNGEGYVERTYKSALNHKVQWQTLWNDLQKLRSKQG
ncbi:MAG: SCO family protein [Salinigranum sp.]